MEAYLLSPADVTALHAMNRPSEFSLSVGILSEDAPEVWAEFAPSRISVFGKRRKITMGVGGERRNETWAEICSERNFRLRLRVKRPRHLSVNGKCSETCFPGWRPIGRTMISSSSYGAEYRPPPCPILRSATLRRPEIASLTCATDRPRFDAFRHRRPPYCLCL